MRRNTQNKPLLVNSDLNFFIPVHEEVEFKDIAKYLDIQMQDSIKKKLEDINEEVENLGKVCDKLYKKSSEEYKAIINKEREDLDKDVKKYIYNLKDNLIGLKNKINYDYKGSFLEVNEKLNKISNELNSSTKQSVLLKSKIDFLKEDCSFLEKQIEDIKDMNIYLKYKLKVFLGEIKEEPKNKNDKKNKSQKNSDKKVIKNDKNDKQNIQKRASKEENKKIEKEKTVNNENSGSKKNIIEDKLYLTATKNFVNKNHKKKYIKNNEFDEVEYLNSKLNLEEAQLINYIQHEKDKNSKLTEIYDNLSFKTKNPHFAYLNNIIDNYNSINASKTLEKNNMSQNSVNNKSYMQSIQSSTLSNSISLGNNKKFYTPENPGHGYIDRKENKEIILNFLESLEAKEIIYKLLYGD